MSTTDSSTDTATLAGEGVPLTRRQIREMEARKEAEAAQAAEATEEVVVEDAGDAKDEEEPEFVSSPEPAPAPAAKPVVVAPSLKDPPRTMVSDTGLPSLFGDDEKEEEAVEEEIKPAVYAREAPANKYLAGPEVKRLPMLPAPKPYEIAAGPIESYPPRSMSVSHPKKEEWTNAMRVKAVGFSVLFAVFYVVFIVIYAAQSIAFAMAESMAG